MTKPNSFEECRHCRRQFLKPVKRAVFCSPGCSLESKTGKRSGDLCWEWQGRLKPNGYGTLSYNGRTYHAHKLALELALGRPLRPGYETCHLCDNRACVNPAHLSEGTRSDNMRGAIQRGRLHPRPPRNVGERHGHSKLTSDDVFAIRASSDSQSVLGKRFGVRAGTIGKIKRRECWVHI